MCHHDRGARQQDDIELPRNRIGRVVGPDGTSIGPDGSRRIRRVPIPYLKTVTDLKPGITVLRASRTSPPLKGSPEVAQFAVCCGDVVRCGRVPEAKLVPQSTNRDSMSAQITHELVCSFSSRTRGRRSPPTARLRRGIEETGPDAFYLTAQTWRESSRLPRRAQRRITSEAVFWSAAAPLRCVSTRAKSIARRSSRAREPGFTPRPRPERRGDTPRRSALSLNHPSQPLPGRLHGQPKQQQPSKEGRCLTLDGVIRANTATGIAATNGRACTTSATGTTTIRATA